MRVAGLKLSLLSEEDIAGFYMQTLSRILNLVHEIPEMKVLVAFNEEDKFSQLYFPVHHPRSPFPKPFPSFTNSKAAKGFVNLGEMLFLQQTLVKIN